MTPTTEFYGVGSSGAGESEARSLTVDGGAEFGRVTPATWLAGSNPAPLLFFLWN